MDGGDTARTGGDTVRGDDARDDGGDPTDTPGVVLKESYAYPHRLDPGTHVGQSPTLSFRLVYCRTRRGPFWPPAVAYRTRSSVGSAPGPIDRHPSLPPFGRSR